MTKDRLVKTLFNFKWREGKKFDQQEYDRKVKEAASGVSHLGIKCSRVYLDNGELKEKFFMEKTYTRFTIPCGRKEKSVKLVVMGKIDTLEELVGILRSRKYGGVAMNNEMKRVSNENVDIRRFLRWKRLTCESKHRRGCPTYCQLRKFVEILDGAPIPKKKVPNRGLKRREKQ